MPRGVSPRVAWRTATSALLTRGDQAALAPINPAAAHRSVLEQPHVSKRVHAWEPFGKALHSYMAAEPSSSTSASTSALLFWSNLRPKNPDIIPPEFFFRTAEAMPPLERRALEICRQRGGRVLDIGAGAGCHTLALAEMGIEAEAIDICPLAVEVMQQRGIVAHRRSFWELEDLSAFTTLILLMNSVSAVGSIASLHEFFHLLYRVTLPGCDVILDIAPPDWAEVHAAVRKHKNPFQRTNFVDEEWAALRCYLSFGSLVGPTFPLLYLEPLAVATAAKATGWRAKLAFEDASTRHALLHLRRQPASRVPSWHPKQR